MKAYWGSGSIAPLLTSALDVGEWLALCPGHFTPSERAPGTHGIGFWVGPRDSLDTVVSMYQNDLVPLTHHNYSMISLCYALNLLLGVVNWICRQADCGL